MVLDPRSLKRLTELIRLNSKLAHFKDMAAITDRARRIKAFRQWIRDHRQEVREMPEPARNDLREAAEYDEEEWQRLLANLLS